MRVTVVLVDGEHRLVGDWSGVEQANAFLQHLRSRAFSPATIRAYAFDLANLGRFLTEQQLDLADVEPVDLFSWVDWQGVRMVRGGTNGGGATVVRFARSSAAPATVNRRVAAVRAFFEFLVMSGTREVNPVPAPRRGQGLRPTARGMLGHLGPGRARSGGRLIREQRRLPESLELADVQAFLTGLRTHRDRAMVLAMLLGGLRSAEVRSLRLAEVDQGRRRLRVLGKGGKERVVPVDAAFFAELTGYLDHCQALGCSDRALRDRLRAARGLLTAHPDLEFWMRQPVTERLVGLRRTRAWSFVVFLIGTGRLRLDLELAVSKNLTGLGTIVESQHARDFATIRDVGLRLGWTKGWVNTVLGDCLAVILAW